MQRTITYTKSETARREVTCEIKLPVYIKGGYLTEGADYTHSSTWSCLDEDLKVRAIEKEVDYERDGEKVTWTMTVKDASSTFEEFLEADEMPTEKEFLQAEIEACTAFGIVHPLDKSHWDV